MSVLWDVRLKRFYCIPLSSPFDNFLIPRAPRVYIEKSYATYFTDKSSRKKVADVWHPTRNKEDIQVSKFLEISPSNLPESFSPSYLAITMISFKF